MLVRLKNIYLSYTYITNILYFYLEILKALSTSSPTPMMAPIMISETISTASNIINATANATANATVNSTASATVNSTASATVNSTATPIVSATVSQQLAISTTVSVHHMSSVASAKTSTTSVNSTTQSFKGVLMCKCVCM